MLPPEESRRAQRMGQRLNKAEVKIEPKLRVTDTKENADTQLFRLKSMEMTLPEVKRLFGSNSCHQDQQLIYFNYFTFDEVYIALQWVQSVYHIVPDIIWMICGFVPLLDWSHDQSDRYTFGTPDKREAKLSVINSVDNNVSYAVMHGTCKGKGNIFLNQLVDLDECQPKLIYRYLFRINGFCTGLSGTSIWIGMMTKNFYDNKVSDQLGWDKDGHSLSWYVDDDKETRFYYKCTPCENRRADWKVTMQIRQNEADFMEIENEKQRMFMLEIDLKNGMLKVRTYWNVEMRARARMHVTETSIPKKILASMEETHTFGIGLSMLYVVNSCASVAVGLVKSNV